MKTTQLAINAISTHHHDLQEALDAYAGAGFRTVELFLPQLKEWLTLGHTVAEARALLAARDLCCRSGFETHFDPAHYYVTPTKFRESRPRAWRTSCMSISSKRFAGAMLAPFSGAVLCAATQ